MYDVIEEKLIRDQRVLSYGRNFIIFTYELKLGLVPKKKLYYVGGEMKDQERELNKIEYKRRYYLGII